MRWSVLVTVMALGAVVAPAAAAQTPTQDTVTGSGRISDISAAFTFEVDARSGPSGESPIGRFTALNLGGGPFFSGPITCLAVRGNVATMNIRTEDLNPGSIITVELTDNFATGSPDHFSGGSTPRAASDCSPFPNGFVSQPLAEGDIVIVDAPPLPTSKDQCKNGGWRDFSGFKNQGDCVSFVATGGKNPPAGG